MHIFASVPDAFEHCLSSKSFSFIRLKEHPLSEPFFPSDVYTVFYSDSAPFNMLIHNHIYRITQGTILIIRPFEYVHPHPCNRQISGFLMFVHPAYLNNLLQYHNNWNACIHPEQDFLHLRFPSAATVSSLKHLYEQVNSTHEFGSGFYTNHACLEFLLSLCLSFRTSPETEIHPEQFYAEHNISSLPFETILSCIDAHFTQNVTHDFFCKAFYVSESHLYRIFKNHTGITLNNYINARKISLMQNRLIKGHNIAESLSVCGFREYSTFLKAFKKHTGCTPTEFISRNKNL